MASSYTKIMQLNRNLPKNNIFCHSSILNHKNFKCTQTRRSIPKIDISSLFRQGDNEIMKVARQIDEACKTCGFFYIVGHPISQKRLDEVSEMTKKFFALPLEEKLKVDIRVNKYHRGYGCLEVEQLDPEKPYDYKETFNHGFHLPLDHPCVAAGRPLRGPNNTPEKPEGFGDLIQSHYCDMQKLSLAILRAMALAIGLNKDFFDTKFDEPLSVFRMLHYPPAPPDRLKDRSIVCGKHSDYGVISILHQDSVGGLQILDNDNQWVDVDPIEGSFVVNIGDMMNMWSNGRYRSTDHRVKVPVVDRYSLVFFAEPNPYTVIECLDHCHSPTNPPKYPPVTAVDWLLSRFAATYEHKRENDAKVLN